MPAEKNALQNYRTEKTVVKLAACTLEPYETNVLADSAAGAFLITMPPVAECIGKIFAIRMVDATAAVTITDHSDSVDWNNAGGVITLNALHDRALLYSDGACWWTLQDLFT
uniref:Uncharacterized protein n=1 Tax=viral metagenome TaxID=1070528 RepID=A0A6M3KMF7_9ZZZZ